MKAWPLLSRMEDSRFLHVLMIVQSKGLRGLGATCRRRRQGGRIHLLHNRPGKNSLSGGPTLSLCFSPMGRPRGLPGRSPGRGRSRQGGSRRQDEMSHLAPPLVALSGLLTELGVVEAQLFGRRVGGRGRRFANCRDAGCPKTRGARLHDSVRLPGQILKVSRGRTSEDVTHFQGQLGEEERAEEGLGISCEGFHVAEKAGRFSIPKTRQGQELHVFGSLSLAEGADESSL